MTFLSLNYLPENTWPIITFVINQPIYGHVFIEYLPYVCIVQGNLSFRKSQATEMEIFYIFLMLLNVT